MTVYLYAKQHNTTGLRYFGKTTRDPLKYNGSGKYWKAHCNKHGWDITTTWSHAYDNIDLCEQEALFFSKVYNIVQSTEWANFKLENGRDGWPKGVPNPRSVPQSEELKLQKSEKLKGKTTGRFGALNPNYGKPMSSETKAKMIATKALNTKKISWSTERREKVAATWAKKKANKEQV